MYICMYACIRIYMYVCVCVCSIICLFIDCLHAIPFDSYSIGFIAVFNLVLASSDLIQ